MTLKHCPISPNSLDPTGLISAQHVVRCVSFCRFLNEPAGFLTLTRPRRLCYSLYHAHSSCCRCLSLELERYDLFVDADVTSCDLRSTSDLLSSTVPRQAWSGPNVALLSIDHPLASDVLSMTEAAWQHHIGQGYTDCRKIRLL